MSKLRQLQETRAARYADVCRLRDEAKDREMTAEERANWDKLVKDVSDLDSQIESEKRFLALQANEAQKQEPREKEDRKSVEGRALRKFLLGSQLNEEELRALYPENREGITPGVSNAQVIIPTTLSGQIEKALGGAQGLLSAVSTFTTSNGGDLTFPTVNDLAAKAKIVAEYQKSAKNNKQFGTLTFKAYTYRTDIIPISEELLQDAAFDIEGEIVNLLSDQFTRGLNYDFTNGSTDKEIKGILAEATAVNAASAAVEFDNLIDLMKSVKAGYQPNAKWMFNSNTLAELMKLKDGNDQYIWQPAVANAVAATIWGKQYILNDDMPDIASGAEPITYGDHSKYKVRYIKGYTAKRFAELYAEYLSIGFMGWGRCDAHLMDAGTHPIVKLKLA